MSGVGVRQARLCRGNTSRGGNKRACAARSGLSTGYAEGLLDVLAVLAVLTVLTGWTLRDEE